MKSAVFLKNIKKKKKKKREILTLRNYYFSPECVMDSKLSRNMPKYLAKTTRQNNSKKFYIIMTSSQKIESMNFQAFFPQCICKQQLELMKFQDLCLYP